MFTLTITLPFFAVVSVIIAGALLGYAIRGGQRLKMRKRIDELESDRHIANTRILELEKETLELESRLRQWQSPVISIKKPGHSTPEENPKITPRDMTLHKDLNSKEDKNRHSASR